MLRPLLILGLFLFVFSPMKAYASACSPMMEGVERVYILVEYFTSHIEESEIPEPLRQENIEKTILELYKRRFSTQECAQFLREKPRQMAKPYKCECSHDQPVELVVRQTGFLTGRDTQLKSGGIATAEMLNDKGTLNVVFTVSIQGNNRHYDPPLEIPHFVITHFLDRPGLSAPILYRVTRASSNPINQSDEKIAEALKFSIIYRLK